MSFRRMGFVVQVRRFGEMIIAYKSFADYLKAAYHRRLYE